MKKITQGLMVFYLIFFPANVLAGCRTSEGISVPVCGETTLDIIIGKAFSGYFLVFLTIVITVGLLLTIFWIWMIVHAATKNIDNKVLWIVLLIIFGHLAAIVYYFVVKRTFDQNQPIITPPPANTGANQENTNK